MATIKLDDITCPITCDIMNDPVTGTDGKNYERAAIQEWLAEHGTSPWNRTHMTALQLTPNRVLKDQIERYRAANPVNMTAQSKPFIAEPCLLTATGHGDFVHLQVTPPLDGPRKPIVIGLGIDMSGSMDELAAAGEASAVGISKRDLVVHSVKAIASMLGPEDMLFFVRFSDRADVCLSPTFMDVSGQEKAFSLADTLKPNGNTNIWHCLQVLNGIASKPEFAGRNVVSAILTDGAANVRPRKGEPEAFKGLPRSENMSTFAYGNELDSKLMSDIATVGLGSLSYLPDYSMLGVFINWVAGALSTCSQNKVVTVSYADGSTSVHQTGLIQYGQARNFVLKTTVPVKHVTMDGLQVTVASGTVNALALARYDILSAVKQCICNEGQGNTYTDVYKKWAGSLDPMVKELIRDCKPCGEDDEGQISIATRYWGTWGKHYSRSWLKAQEMELCMNFKDPGLQIYGGDMYRALQTMGDEVFCNLPPIKPTSQRSYYAASVSTINAPALYNPQIFLGAGGCWAPSSLVLMADGSRMPIEKVRKGMLVWTPDGPALVDYALVLGSKQQKQYMCQVGDLLITPYHPIKNKTGEWVFPISIVVPVEMVMPVVHNLILSSGHVIDLGGVLSVSLGHEFGGPIIEHKFFGSRASVLKDLVQISGFKDGHVVFKDLHSVRDSAGAITGWYDAA